MMVMGADQPRIIKIKATIAADEVRAALAAYHLSGSAARSHEVYFCEQPSQLGLLPLLDGAVILRVRHHPAGPGDVTVKLRPCQARAAQRSVERLPPQRPSSAADQGRVGP